MININPENIRKLRETYPTECASCGGPLEGPGTDENIKVMLEEHNDIFPGGDASGMETVCDPCFQRVCPGGKKLSLN